jgi:hypothetical protein
MSIINLPYFSELNLNNSSKEKEEGEEVCIANISPLERQKRLRFGIRQFIFTLVILAVLIVLHANSVIMKRRSKIKLNWHRCAVRRAE